MAREILSTEVSYISSLSSLETLCFQPLADLASDPNLDKPPLTINEIGELFSNLPVIARLHRSFLNDLQEKIKGYTDATCLGSLFLDFAPFFKMYTQYVSNHEASLRLLQKLNKRESFVAFLNSCGLRSTLDSYLIMPIQRIPRYKLLLEELLKHTTEQHADYADVQRAVDVVGLVASHMNEAVRMHQDRMTVMAIQEKFIGKQPNFFAPSRVLIRQGLLTVQSLRCLGTTSTTTNHPKFPYRDANKARRYHFFLFNDMLAYASLTITGSFKFKGRAFNSIFFSRWCNILCSCLSLDKGKLYL